MIAALWLLLAAAPTVLFEGVLEIPPARWRGLELPTTESAAILRCHFTVDKPNPGVRVALLARREFDRLQEGESYRTLATTAFYRDGLLIQSLPVSDQYVLLVVNELEGRRAVPVRLKVSIESQPGAVAARELPAHRRWIVVISSLMLFAGIVLFTVRRLAPAIRGF